MYIIYAYVYIYIYMTTKVKYDIGAEILFPLYESRSSNLRGRTTKSAWEIISFAHLSSYAQVLWEPPFWMPGETIHMLAWRVK